MQPRTRRGEEGQSMILIAMLVVAMVGFLGLVIDGGREYANRRESQNASDSSAFAGARELMIRTENIVADTKIKNSVLAFAKANRATADADIQAYYVTDSDPNVHCRDLAPLNRGTAVGLGSVPPNANGVRVYVTLRYQPFLITVLNGAGPVNNETCATAMTGLAGAQSAGLQPIAVPRCYVDSTDPTCGSNASKTSHIIVGQGAQDVPGANPDVNEDFRGIINLNDRVDSSGQRLDTCGGSGDKQDMTDYILGGGYDNSCGQINFNDRDDLLTGNSNGNAGVDAYAERYPNWATEPVTITVAVYGECISNNNPPYCGTVGSGTNARVKIIGFAAMRITNIGSNSMSAVFAGYWGVNQPISDMPCNPPGCVQKIKAVQLQQ